MAVTEERMLPDIHLALHREGSITRPAMGHKRGPLNHDSRPLRVEFFFFCPAGSLGPVSFPFMGSHSHCETAL